jgi:hypothetical protein
MQLIRGFLGTLPHVLPRIPGLKDTLAWRVKQVLEHASSATNQPITKTERRRPEILKG